MLKQLLEYKHSMISNQNTSELSERKSKVFGGVYYIFRNNKLVMIADGTVANDSHELSERLKLNKFATENELEMLSLE